MKTKLFAKTQSQKNSIFEVLSGKEMKEICGGLRMIAIRDENGNVRVIFVP